MCCLGSFFDDLITLRPAKGKTKHEDPKHLVGNIIYDFIVTVVPAPWVSMDYFNRFVSKRSSDMATATQKRSPATQGALTQRERPMGSSGAVNATRAPADQKAGPRKGPVM